MKGTAVGKIFVCTYSKLTMEYHEIKIYSIIHQSYALGSKYFENSWFRFLGNFQILMKVNLIKLSSNRLLAFHDLYKDLFLLKNACRHEVGGQIL